MTKKCCCCTLFSCFSGNNRQSASAQALANNTDFPAVATENDNGQSASAQALANNTDSPAVATENDNINLDSLINDISGLLNNIKTKSSDKKPSTDKYWPRNSFFSKLKEILSEAADGASALKDTISPETMKVVQNILTGVGQAHWVAAGFLVVANILDRFETVSANQDECLSVLEEMNNLAQHVKDLKERPSLKTAMEASIKRATEMVVEGALMCSTQMNSSGVSRFIKSSVNKDDLDKFQQKLQKMYRCMDNQRFICVLDAIECMNVRPPVKERERSYPEYAVGIEKQLEEVIELLEWESNKNALAVMVHGFGGTGKSTLADAVFARLYIEGCKYSMVRMFDDINSTPNIKKLQKCIVKDLMAGRGKEDQESVLENIRTFEDGQRAIGDLLEKEVAFIYIDNVLGKDELENLLPRNVEKAKKLRLLITTRDREVRKGCSMNAVKFHPMKFLPDTEAMNLLKEEMHYGKDEGMALLNPDQLDQIVSLCGGIPKLLSVLARFLRLEEGGQQKAFNMLMEEKKKWNVQIGDGRDIEGYLFAYDRLPERVKDPFLDICSFFNDWDWNKVSDIVGEFNLNVLEKRGLVNNRDMTVTVHDVILTIGCQKTEGTRFKFQSRGQLEDFLKKDTQGIKGIWVEIDLFSIDSDSTVAISATKLDSMSDSLRILALGDYAKVEGKCEKTFEKLVLFQGEVSYLPFNVSQSKELELRYLKCQTEDLNLLREMPSNLKYMELDGRLHSKDVFEFSSSDIQQCKSLRTVRLLRFKSLKKLPEVWGDSLNCLQELDLSSCESIEELPGSISKLQSLRVLDISFCFRLKRLPEDFGSLGSLQRLDLSFSVSIEELPGSISKLQSLRELNMSACSSLKRLPEDFGSLGSLQELYLSSCESIEELPGSISKLQSLRELNMSECSSLKKLPEDFGSLGSLQILDLSSCDSIEELPGSISKLQSLRELNMSWCSSLKKLPEDFGSLKSLKFLRFNNCTSLDPLSEQMLQNYAVTEIF